MVEAISIRSRVCCMRVWQGSPRLSGLSAAGCCATLAAPPRPVRVFRPTVSPELEAMLEKALATAPADRFQNAKEFEAALAAAPVTSTSASRPGRRSHRLRNLALGAAGVATLATAVAIGSHFAVGSTEFVGDTTQIVLLPMEGDDADRSTQVYEAMYQGLGRWRDVSTTDEFKVREAVRRSGGVSSEISARRVAAPWALADSCEGGSRVTGPRGERTPACMTPKRDGAYPKRALRSRTVNPPIERE